MCNRFSFFYLFISSFLELIRIIRLTYSDTNPSPFSLDLLQAVERQYIVSTRMLNDVKWLLPDSIVRGMRNYTQFLTLMKENNQLIAVPTLEIDVSWHTHQLHPLEYRQFTLKYIKRVINHDDTIPQITLDRYSLDTRKAWDKLLAKSNDSENSSIHSDETDTSNKKGNVSILIKIILYVCVFNITVSIFYLYFLEIHFFFFQT